MKNAFTLAEVLITLGIIGIVAAMTLPVLIQKNNNRIVETRLMKFYSSINQAVKMAEADYGDKIYWWDDLTGCDFDIEGNPIEGSSQSEKWFKKYIAAYMKILKIETVKYDGSFRVYFPDGSALQSLAHTTRDWIFYTGNPNKCDKAQYYGICSFHFNFKPTDTQNATMWKYHINKGFEPWKYNWDGDIENLKKACYKDITLGADISVPGKAYCTAVIQYYNWKIPDDYPYKVSY